MATSVVVKFLGENKGLVQTLDDTDSRVGKFAKATTAALAALGVGGAAALGSGFLKTLNREALNDRIAGSLGLDDAQMERIAADASRTFGQAWGENIEEVTRAVGRIDQAGLVGVGQSMDDLSASAFAFAEIVERDVQEGIERASFLLKHDMVADGQEAFDLLVRSAQQVSPEIQDELFAATEEYAQYFGALGLNAEEMFAGFIAAGEGGARDLDKYGDALKELTILGTDMSARSAAAFESMGKDQALYAELLLEGGDSARDALFGIVRGLQGIEDPVEQANAAIALFGAPLEDMGTEAIPEFLTAIQGMSGGIDGVEGAAGRLSDQLGDNFMTRLTSLKRRGFEALIGAVNTHLYPAFLRLEQWVGDRLPPAIETGRRVLGQLRSALTRAVAPVLDTVVPALQSAADWVGEHLPDAIDTGKEILDQFRDALVDAAEPVLDVVVPAIESVVDWVGEQLPDAIDGAVGVAQTIADQWPRVTEAFSATVDWMRSNWPYVIGAMSGIAVVWLGSVIPAAVATTTALWAQAAAWIAAAAPVIAANVALLAVAAAFAAAGAGVVYAYRNVEWFRDAVDAVKDWMLNDLVPTVKAVWDGIKTAIGVAISAAQVVIETAVGVIQTLWSTFGDTIVNFARSTWDNITQIIQGAIDIVMGIVDVFVGLFTGDWEKLWDGIEKIVDGVWDVITGIIDQALDTVVAAAEAIWTAVKNGASAAWDLVKSTVSDAVTALPGLILDGGAALLRAGRGLLLRVRDGAIAALETAWNWISGWVTGLPGRIAELGVSLASAAYDMFKGFYDKAVEWLSQVADKIEEYVLGPLDSAAQKLADLGAGGLLQDIVSGAVNLLVDTSDGGAPVDPAANGSIPDGPLLDAAKAAAASGGVFADGGFVGRFRGPNRPVPILAHEGEFVLSRDDVENIVRAGGRGPGIHIDKIEVSDGRDLVSEIALLETIYGTVS